MEVSTPILPWWVTSPTVWTHFKRLCQTLYDTVVELSQDRGIAQESIKSAAAYVRDFPGGGIQEMVALYVRRDNAAHSESQRSVNTEGAWRGRKKRRTEPRPYTYGDIKRWMDRNTAFRAVILSTLYMDLHSIVTEECEKRAKAAEESEHWCEDANMERAEMWEARVQALSDHAGQNFIDEFRVDMMECFMSGGTTITEQLWEHLDMAEDSEICLEDA